ncbi:MAG: Gfo/Idh/MocA family oxidoreductase [Bryobacterales bacterium]|nr:Gfo/Idh/MocA family oxidoreductase [Bryobacteraceae bacterium]MDW8355605.1 Gfo/Idh/MocA family oxidoreductase [Bryobacterales bacterium]
MPSLNRRTWLQAAVAAPFVARPTVRGANDRIRLGFIGLGGRAQWLIQHEEFPGAEIVALADCFLPRCEQAAKLKPSGERWAKYQDYRRMLDREKLDAVFVATTTHARVLICIHALQAGLDVYAEKPLALTVAEGRALVHAVRRYNRVLQTGTQQRSIPINVYASKFIREGGLGKVHTVIACNFEGPQGWYPKPPQPIPDGLDWDLWCNQAELRPYHPHLRRRWAWFWDYDGGGQSWGVTGWGTHALDQVQCGLGTDDTGPVEIWPESDGWNAPVTMRYANGTLLKLHGQRRPDHSDLGAIFIGDKGRIEIKRGTCVADPPELLKGAPPDTPEGPGENRYHIENFLDCVRTRKKPNAHEEIGHRSTTVCLLVNICRDLGRKLEWDPVAERFVGDEQANSLLSRPRRRGYELPAIA